MTVVARVLPADAAVARFNVEAGQQLSTGATLLVVGANHRTAPLAVRERLAVPAHDRAAALARLRALPALQETALLSTCNRTEWYLVTHDPAATTSALLDDLSFRSGLAPSVLQPHLYSAHGAAAATHLFGVAGGLDSMILGESEITAQVRQAYLTAQEARTIGPKLHRLFQKAFHNAKLIRSRTPIATGHASIGSIVVQLTRSLFGERLSECEVLLWGAGKAAEVTTRHLIKSGIGQLWIVNRTAEKAQALAQQCRGGWLSWEQAQQRLAHVDVAVVCTEAPHYVIDTGDMERLQAARGSRPLCLIDLAVPRNVDPAIARMPGIHLYDVDGLQGLAQTALENRQRWRGECDAMMHEQGERFWRWWQGRMAEGGEAR